MIENRNLVGMVNSHFCNKCFKICFFFPKKSFLKPFNDSQDNTIFIAFRTFCYGERIQDALLNFVKEKKNIPRKSSLDLTIISRASSFNLPLFLFYKTTRIDGRPSSKKVLGTLRSLCTTNFGCRKFSLIPYINI